MKTRSLKDWPVTTATRVRAHAVTTGIAAWLVIAAGGCVLAPWNLPARTLTNGHDAMAEGNYAAAERYIKRAVRDARSSSLIGPDIEIDALSGLALLYYQSRDFERTSQAIDELRRSISRERKETGNLVFADKMIWSYWLDGAVEDARGNGVRAQERYEHALDLCATDTPNNQPACRRHSRNRLEKLLVRYGRYEDAAPLFEEDLRSQKHPSSFASLQLGLAGEFYAEYGNYERATELFEKARHDWQRLRAPIETSPAATSGTTSGANSKNKAATKAGTKSGISARIGRTGFGLAPMAGRFMNVLPLGSDTYLSIAERKGDSALAAKLRRERTRLWRDTEVPVAETALATRLLTAQQTRKPPIAARLGETHHAVAYALRHRGQPAGTTLEHYHKALKYYEAARIEDDQTTAPRHWFMRFYVAALLETAEIEIALGQTESSQARYERILSIAPGELHERHRAYLDALAGLAEVKQRRHDYTAALKLYERYLELAERTRGREHPDYKYGEKKRAEARAAAESFR